MATVQRTCAECGAEFETDAYRLLKGRGKFCGRVCSGRFNTRGKRHNWQGGRRLMEGYVLVFAPGDPHATINGKYAFEHRLIAAALMGRPLTSEEVVHHINGVKTDNRPENLAITTQSAHIRDHHGFLNKLQRRRALILLAIGWNLREVAAFFGCSMSVIHKVDMSCVRSS